MNGFLLCTDLDRTLIPNGAQPESPGARPLFAALVARPEISLAYVTGRHQALVESCMAEYGLPAPDFVVADVGAAVHAVRADGWHRVEEWDTILKADWKGASGRDIHALLRDVSGLTLQEEEKQARHKLSYYVPLQAATDDLPRRLRGILEHEGLRSNLVWSVDELQGVGLLDVLPASAGKHRAIRFLMARYGFAAEWTMFAGDSGNDLDVFDSGIQCVMVANAHAEVRALAGTADGATLYAAGGGYGMNGNYAAGILEGAAHYWPWVARWLGDMTNKEN